MRIRRALPLVLSLAAAAAACGPPTVQPVLYPDPGVPCPAGLLTWSLEIVDQRADPEGAGAMIGAIQKGIQGSFPGCQWNTGTPGASISIVVHAFRVPYVNGYYEAVAQWSVTARNASGTTVAEFEADESETRPGYSGAEKAALTEAFRKAMLKTVHGLGQIQRLGSLRPPGGTIREVEVGSKPAAIAAAATAGTR